MLGVSHAATGLLAGVAVGALFGSYPVDVVSCAAVGAGAALLPDLDEPGSTVGRSLGVVTRGVSRLLRAASCRVYRSTGTPYELSDSRSDGGHRHLTHTVPAVLVFGLVAGLLSLHLLGAWAVVMLLAVLGLSPAVKSFRGQERRAALSLAWFAATSLGVAVVVFGSSPWLIGATVAAGALVHVLGDWLTRSGVPLAWPVVHRGKRWWMFRSPMPFVTGASRVEDAIRWVCLAGAPAVAVLTVL